MCFIKTLVCTGCGASRFDAPDYCNRFERGFVCAGDWVKAMKPTSAQTAHSQINVVVNLHHPDDSDKDWTVSKYVNPTRSIDIRQLMPTTKYSGVCDECSKTTAQMAGEGTNSGRRLVRD